MILANPALTQKYLKKKMFSKGKYAKKCLLQGQQKALMQSIIANLSQIYLYLD